MLVLPRRIDPPGLHARTTRSPFGPTQPTLPPYPFPHHSFSLAFVLLIHCHEQPWESSCRLHCPAPPRPKPRAPATQGPVLSRCRMSCYESAPAGDDPWLKHLAPPLKASGTATGSIRRRRWKHRAPPLEASRAVAPPLVASLATAGSIGCRRWKHLVLPLEASRAVAGSISRHR